MRIAQLAPPWEPVPPPHYGGTERVIWLLTEELVRRGHAVTLFASGDSRTSARLIPTVASAAWRHSSLEDGLAFIATSLDEVYSRADEFDVIHSHVQYWPFPLARLCPIPPLVTTLHGRLDLPEYSSVFGHFRDLPLVSISDAQRAPLRQANWLATVYHGLPLEDFPFQPRPEGYLAFLGRIAPEKGLHTAIHLASRAGMPLKIAARMPLDQPHNAEAQRDWAYYREVVQPLLHQPGIEYLGELDDLHKARLLGGASGLVFPIDWPEPFGLVMIEALACGTPVLALRRGSTPEVVEHEVTGFLADDADGLLACVDRLGELDRARCRAAAEQRFSAAGMAAGYERVYAQLLGMPFAVSDNGAAMSDSISLRQGAQVMAEKTLDGLRVAIVTATDFEQAEMTEPRKALEGAGAQTVLISPKRGDIQGVRHDIKIDTFRVDMDLAEADPEGFDALLLPGGALNADALRVDPQAQSFVRHFQERHKPMAVICHAPWLLASAGLARGRKLTSYHTIRDDMRNAGAEWLDQDVVVDDNLVTSRQPSDIPAFNREMLTLFTRFRAQTGQRPVAHSVQEYVGAEDLRHQPPSEAHPRL